MAAAIRFGEGEDLIDIRMDNVFKAVFTKNSRASKTALARLVSAVIGRDVKVLTIAANEPPIESTRDRQIRFDINCQARGGEKINVEMCLNPDPFEPVRLEFYTAKLFSGQDIRGTDKSYDVLKRTYQIAILARKRFFPDGDFFHSFEYYDPTRRVSLNGQTRILTLELTKLEEVAQKPARKMSAPEKWAVYFQYLNNSSMRPKINEIIEQEEGIAMASEVLRGISRDEAERARLLSEYKGQVDQQSKMAYAKQQGIKRGRKEGREEANLENARKMKGLGISIKHIHTVTGLPAETIKKL